MSINVKDCGAVGDGVTNDTAAFQTALTAAAYEVYVPSGTYAIDANVLTVPAGLVVRGAGESSVLKRIPGGSQTNILTINQDNVVLKDLALDGNRQEPGADDLRGALDLEGAKDLLVRDVTVRETHSFGIRMVFDCQRIRFVELKLINTGNTAIRVVTSANTAGLPIRDLSIHDCVIDKRGSGIVVGTGIQVQARDINPVTNLSIHNCQVLMDSGTSGMGIELLGSSTGELVPAMFDVSVRNCYIAGTNMGLTCGQVVGFTYAGNIIDNCLNTSIQFGAHREGVILDNVINTTEGVGMAAFQGPEEVKTHNVIVADNVVNNAALSGIVLVGGTDILVHDNLVRSERLTDGSDTNGKAFRFYDVHRLNFHDNFIDGIDPTTQIAVGLQVVNCNRVMLNKNAGRNVVTLYDLHATGVLVPDVKGTFLDNVVLENVTTPTNAAMTNGAVNSIVNWPNVHNVG